MNELRFYKPYGIIIIFGIIFFIPFLGGVHLFDWDEINFAESAREMIISGNYLDVQINFIPFWEKPPLFMWMQVLSMKMFGINEFAARFPNAICGIVCLIVIFSFGRKLRDERFAWLWVISYVGSVLPFFYFKSGIIDPWFNLFIFIGFIYFIIYINGEGSRLRNLGLSAFFIGLAILTKGPVALLVFGLSFTFLFIYKRFKIKTGLSHILIFFTVLSLTGGFWFILQIINGNYQIVQDFINYQIRLFTTEDAGHGGFLLYHFVVLLTGVFPASIFAIPAIKIRKNEKDDLHVWMLILFWTVLILFTIVKTKIVHYSSLCYFPLSFFSAVFLYKYIYEKQILSKFQRSVLLLIAVLFGLIVSALPVLARFKTIIIGNGLIKDPFAQANLMAEVKWTWFEPVLGLCFIIAVAYFLIRTAMDKKTQVCGIFISTILFVFASMIMIVPRIEAYSQRTAIEFYRSVSDEDAYIATIGFKSYAHLFYGEAKPHKIREMKNLEWLLDGKTDKPVYFVFKINRKEKYLKQYPQLKFLYEKNGFVFATRYQK